MEGVATTRTHHALRTFQGEANPTDSKLGRFVPGGCQPIVQIMDFKWDHKILFCYLPEPKIATAQAAPPSSATTSVVVVSKTNATPAGARAATPLISPGADSIKVAETVSLPTTGTEFAEVFADTIDEDLTEHLDFYVVSESTLLTTYEFVIFHALVYDTIESWTRSGHQKDPFAIDWRRWKFHGPLETNPFAL